MTQSRRQDRPPRATPAGIGQGLAAMMVIAAALPFLTLMGAAAWSSGGIDAWLGNIGWGFVLTLLLLIPPVFGGMWRRYWAVCWTWSAAALLLLAYPICLLIAAAAPLGWARARGPDELFLADYALGGMLLCAPACWWLLRLVRLRFLQPWTMPDQWEGGAAPRRAGK